MTEGVGADGPDSSRIVMTANYIVMTDGTNYQTPFVFSGGTLYLNNLVVAQSVSVQSAATGARTIITDSLIQVYDSSNVERVRLGVW